MGRATAEMDPQPLPEPPVYFPLRWESTGEQWWYATPVDLAAANGHYDLVRALLRVDSNLLIKLTSLRRIRRLETVWDDHPDFIHAPRGRAAVARALLHDCEARGRYEANSLIRAGYSGWLLYTAAAAGDVEFIQELLRREPFLVFGEGEFGVTDILYAAARSKSSVVFTMILHAALTGAEAQGEGEEEVEKDVFKGEIMSRAVHAAARGGSWEVLRELLLQSGDVLGCRDVEGRTVLHAAAARGQVEVVRNLVESFEITNSRDNQGNTALHLAAYRGNLEVVKVLVLASLSSSAANDAGDTFLHMAVSGFRTPGFRRLDRQLELMKELVSGRVVCLAELINLRNNEGRTALHLAMIENINCDLVELLISVPSIDLNICDLDGLTPLDLLKLHPHSASSEILIKQLVSAGGISNSQCHLARNVTSQLKMQSMGSSPGTCFKISDAEIFLYSGTENIYDPVEKACSVRSSSCSNSSKSGEFSHFEVMDMSPGPPTIHKPSNSVTSAARRLKNLLGWPYKKGRSKQPASEVHTAKGGTMSGWQHGGDEESMEDKHSWYDRQDTPTPLRQRFSTASFLNNKRTFAVRRILPSPSAKKRFAAELTHGVIQGMPHLVLPSQPASEPSSSEKPEGHGNGPSGCKSSISSEPYDGLNSSNSLMNQYFCFGAHGLLTENQIPDQQKGHPCRRTIFSEA